MTYLSIGLAISLALIALRLYGLRGDVASARRLAKAREVERDSVLARLAAEEDKAARMAMELRAKEKEIKRLWQIAKESRSTAALDALLDEELGGG